MKVASLFALATLCFSEASASACAIKASSCGEHQNSHQQLTRLLATGCSKNVQRIKIDDKNLFIIKDRIKSKRIFVKVLSSKIYSSESQCLDEIQQLKLPYFPKYYGYCELSNDSVALMLEYISKCDLHTLITCKWRRNEHNDLVIYAAQLAYTIHTLHQNRIVHRDIKLENIVLSSDKSHIKLVDYDCAVIAETQERMNSISGMCGSIDYLAPEVLNNATYTYKCDWYSFGIVLFRMHSGGKMLPSEATFHHNEKRLFPIKDHNAKVLIQKLLRPENERLSSLEQIKQEPYFAGIDWFLIENFPSKH
jgi:serine/threonine protein kinase